MSFKITDNKILLKKPVVDVEYAFELVNELNKLDEKGVGSIVIDMKNSHSLPSIVIGKLMILKEKGINIEIIIHSNLSYALFEDLGLTSIFDIKFDKQK